MPVIVGLAAAQKSPTMALLIGVDELRQTLRAAEGSDIWSDNLARALGHRIEVAMAAGVRERLAQKGVKYVDDPPQ